MNKLDMQLKSGLARFVAGALLTASMGLWSTTASANHTVLVEGETDFDGDGAIGMTEDADGDQVFGTINGGVGMAGVAGNGRVIIVTSGRFFESVQMRPTGVLVLEAAPGVNAIVEAFNAGDSDVANNRRQRQPGIIVWGAPFPVEIRNIVSRNWTIGILVRSGTHVTIDDVKVDSNVNYGIQILGSNAAVTDSQINSSGFRASGTLGPTPGGAIPPNPGVGIEYSNGGTGFIANTTIAHSFADGIDAGGNVQQLNNIVFNNNQGM